MDPDALDTAPVVARERGALRAALRYVRATPSLRVPLLMMALVGTLSFNFIVLLPLLARFSFDGGASSYAGLMAAMGVGSVLGALVIGARGRVSNRLLVRSCALFGALILLLAVTPTLGLAAAVLVPLGAASVTFAAGVNSALQLAVSPEMRGRVLALYSMVFLGSTPIGGPLSGWVAETWSPRLALLVGGIAALIAAVVARAAFSRAHTRPTQAAISRVDDEHDSTPARPPDCADSRRAGAARGGRVVPGPKRLAHRLDRGVLGGRLSRKSSVARR
jgi:MFS family permease